MKTVSFSVKKDSNNPQSKGSSATVSKQDEGRFMILFC